MRGLIGLAGVLALAAAAPHRPPDPLGRPIDRIGPPATLAVIDASGFGGRVLAARGDRIILRGEFREPFDHRGSGDMGLYGRTMIWPWASVTKQVVATMVMQQVAAGTIALDAPASRYLSGFRGPLRPSTVRALLQHRSGLRNPDDTNPDTITAGWLHMPGFYTIGPTGPRWCLTGRRRASDAWRYNNCDYLVLGALLEAVTHKPLPRLFREEIAAPLKLAATGFAGVPGTPRAGFYAGPSTEDLRVIARFGGSGGLIGSEDDLLRFDRGLLSGRLLPPAARAVLWHGDVALGGMALGQWSFSASLKGCPAPVRIVERRGEIGRFGVRNILLPDRDISVIAFTNRKDFSFGEIWQRKGFSYDLLSAVACA